MTCSISAVLLKMLSKKRFVVWSAFDFRDIKQTPTASSSGSPMLVNLTETVRAEPVLQTRSVFPQGQPTHWAIYNGKLEPLHFKAISI